MKKMFLLALLILIATPALAGVACNSGAEPVINLAPLAWELDTSLNAESGFGCSTGSCFSCVQCCNQACGWLDPCNESCWQAHCAGYCS